MAQEQTNYSVNTLISEVRVILDHNMQSKPLIDDGDIDTLSLNENIQSAIPRAARIVEGAAPVNLLGQGDPFSGTIYWPKAVGVGSGHIQLPDDFLRLICFQMSDWIRPASTIITQDDPLYAQQKSEFEGIRGNPYNPVVAIVPWSTGLELEFYSCNVGSTVTVRRARYLKKPVITGTGDAATINISTKLKDAIAYYAAGLVATTLGDDKTAQDMIEHSKSLIV